MDAGASCSIPDGFDFGLGGAGSGCDVGSQGNRGGQGRGSWSPRYRAGGQPSYGSEAKSHCIHYQGWRVEQNMNRMLIGFVLLPGALSAQFTTHLSQETTRAFDQYVQSAEGAMKW